MNPTEIHGWRVYRVRTCNRTQELVLVGQYQMHVHSADSPRAVCRGFNAGAAWIREDLDDHTHGDWDTPAWNCSCGYYAWRAFPQEPNKVTFLAHVTALGETIIHEEGWRTAHYIIDYLLQPTEPALSIDYKAVPPEEVNTTMRYIAQSLDVPMLRYSDAEGCVKCRLDELRREEVKRIANR
jgi:hypothetical protein